MVHPDHPYTITRHEKFRIILADGVDVAIEVKPDIASASELQRGLEQGLTVKALRREGPFSLSLMGDTPELLEHSKRVPYFIFAMRAKKDWRNTAADVLKFYKSRGVPPLDQADAIVINGVGILANFPVSGRYPWEIIPEYRRDTG